MAQVWLSLPQPLLICIRGETRKTGAALRAMTCSPVMGRKVVDILQDFRLWINSLRVYGISLLKSRDREFIMTELGFFWQNFRVVVRFVEILWSFP
jgi:hypothetical protein